MTVLIGIAGRPEWYTVDPEVVPGSRHLKDGDYFRLPTGEVYRCNTDNCPTKFTLVPEAEIPSGVEILKAKRYNTMKNEVVL